MTMRVFHQDKAKPLLVEFGHGKVAVMLTADTLEGAVNGVAFAYTVPHPIGWSDPSVVGKSTDEIETFLRFRFLNAASVQVVLDNLTAIRNSLEAAHED